MARSRVEYDEIGNTFLYAVLAFYALILIPISYFLWPKCQKRTAVVHAEYECKCEGCNIKRKKRQTHGPKQGKSNIIRYIVLAILWALLAILVNKTSNIEVTHEEYDPYTILGVDQGAETSVVKKAYRELTKIHHPDRGGDAEAFDKIAKAHQALTNDESRENWEKYGNPDGPKAAVYGIALPSWVVSDQYGYIFLFLYVLILMIGLPVAVSYWWKNAVKYSAQKVMVKTTQIFYHFIAKTPKMEFNRIIMIFGGSAEFDKDENAEIVTRENDEKDVAKFMRELKNLNAMNREAPLSSPYGVKARALVHAHLTRLELWSEELEADLEYTLKKVPMLANEFIKCATQIYFYYGPERSSNLETFELATKFTSYMVQALWPKNSPILQLPHVEEMHVSNFRKHKILTLQDVAETSEKKRKLALASLTDEQYENAIQVLATMPKIELEAHVEVEDEDEAHIITSGALVTIRVSLKRTTILDNEKRLRDIAHEAAVANGTASPNEEKPVVGGKKVWEKNNKKKGGNKKKKGVAPKKSTVPKTAAEEEEGKKEGSESSRNENEDASQNDEDEESSDSDSIDGESDDEEFFKRTQKKPNFDADNFETIPVHCPLYPEEKYEWWYVYMFDKKSKTLTAPIELVKTLRDEEMKEIKFMAGGKGLYEFTIVVRSDSYVDVDYSTDVKITVKEPEVIPVAKIDYGVDEDEEGHGGSDTEEDYEVTDDDSDSD